MTLFTSRKVWVIGISLILAMAMTRGHHFASVVALPDASLSLFFIAGAIALPLWFFPLLVLEAVLLDFMAINFAGVSSFCVTPAYGMLLPAYASLWFAGSVFRRFFSTKAFPVASLLLCALVGTACYELISSGSFYLLSGYFNEPSLSEFADRLAKYAPSQFKYTLIYLSVAGVIYYLASKFITAVSTKVEFYEHK